MKEGPVQLRAGAQRAGHLSSELVGLHFLGHPEFRDPPLGPCRVPELVRYQGSRRRNQAIMGGDQPVRLMYPQPPRLVRSYDRPR